MVSWFYIVLFYIWHESNLWTIFIRWSSFAISFCYYIFKVPMGILVFSVTKAEFTNDFLYVAIMFDMFSRLPLSKEHHGKWDEKYTNVRHTQTESYEASKLMVQWINIKIACNKCLANVPLFMETPVLERTLQKKFDIDYFLNSKVNELNVTLSIKRVPYHEGDLLQKLHS